VKDYKEPLSALCDGVIDESEGRHRGSTFKRLEEGSFQMPQSVTQDGVELQPAQLAMLLSGIDLNTARQRRRFRRPA
jgi:hypothetical protein